MRRPPPGALAALLLAAVAGWLGSRVHLDDDISRMLPDSDPRLARALEVMRGLLDRTVVDVGVAADPPPSPAELGELADELAADLAGRSDGATVRARFGAGDLLPVLDALRANAPVLLDAAAWPELERRVDPASVPAAIATLARRLQEPDGAAVRATAATDPLGLRDLALAPLRELTAGFADARVLDGRMIAADGRHVLLFVEPGIAPADPRAPAYVAAVEASARALEAAHADRAVTVRHIGAHRATADNAALVKRDVMVTSTFGVVAVAVLAVLCFGSLWLALLALTPALYGTVIALGAFALLADSLTGAVIGFGAVLLGLTIDFAVHVLFRLRAAIPTPVVPPRSRWRLLDVFATRAGTRELPVRALSMGAMTTAGAFVTLSASSLPGVRDIGWFGAVGILAAGAFALVVLPWFGRGLRTRARAPLDLRALVAGWARPRPKAVLAALALTPLLALGTCRVEFDGDPDRLSGLSPAAAADEAGLFATWGEAFRATTLVVEHEDLDAALAANDALADTLAELRADGTVRAFASVAALLPSAATQRRRAAAWRDFWSGERRAALAAALDRATAATVFRDGAFAEFIAGLAADPVPLDPHAARAGPLRPLLADRIRVDRGRYVVTTQVFVDSWAAFERLTARLDRELPGVVVLNKAALVRRLGDMVGGEIATLGALAFAVVAVIVWLWLGSLELTLVVVVPLLLSLVWTVGLLGALGIPLTLPNSIFVVFLFGVAVDYAIFLTVSRVERIQTGADHVVEAHASVLLCAITTCLGFGSLTLARHPVMFTIGATALVGLCSAAVVTQLFVPVLAAAFARRGGPFGAPTLGCLWPTAWTACTMLGRSARHLIGARSRDQQATVEAIGAIARRIRDRLPVGRRRYLDAAGAPLTALPVAGPCVIVSNHGSAYDVMALLALPAPIQILVKRWVWDAPVIGPMVRRAGYVLADGGPDAIVEALRDRAARGMSLLVFPEGTRSKTGRVGRFHSGAFATARALDLPVVPVALVGSRHVVPPGAWWVGDHDVRVVVLEPMHPHDWAGDGADRRMARAARDRIRDRVRAERPAVADGPAWRRTVANGYRFLGPVLAQYARWKIRLDPLIAALPRLCPGDGPILIGGCGYGIMTTRLALAYPERTITAADLDEHKLRLAERALGPELGVRFELGDVRAIDGEYEHIVLADVLHYCADDDQLAILRHLAALLRPGGRLLFRDGCRAADTSFRSNRAAELFATTIGFSTIDRPFAFRDEAGWRELIAAAGLSIERVHDELGTWSNVVITARREPFPPAR